MASPIENFKANLVNGINKQPTVVAAKTWYQALPSRDAAIVRGLAVVASLCLVYLWIWVPVENYRASAQAKLQSEMTLHRTLKENAYKVSGAKQNGAPVGQSVLAIVNSTSRAKDIKLSRFEPEGENGLRIWLDKVKFDDVVDWLDLLENEQGVRVTQINIDKVEPGTVNLRAVLQR